MASFTLFIDACSLLSKGQEKGRRKNLIKTKANCHSRCEKITQLNFLLLLVHVGQDSSLM